MISFSSSSSEDRVLAGYSGSSFPSLTFWTNSTERMRIDNAGNVGIGINNPSAKLDINGSIVEAQSSPTITSNTLTLDASLGTFFAVNLNSSITSAITISNVPTGNKVYSFILQFTYPDSTVRTVVWPTNTRWSNNTAPGLTCVTNKIDTFTFLTTNNGTNWLAFISGQNQ
jgi:hypothetical protein